MTNIDEKSIDIVLNDQVDANEIFGAHDKHLTILEDYLKTNEQRKAANEQIIAQYQANGTSPAEIQQLETMLYVKKEYLATAYDRSNR